MAATQKIIFASENIQLGAVALLELWRMANSGVIELVAVWSNQPDRAVPPLGAEQHAALRSAKNIDYPGAGDGVVLDGVFVPDYSMLCRELGLKYHLVKDMNPIAGAALAGLGLDYGFCCGHGQVFPKNVLEAPRKGWVNIHPSLLPRHRGPMPGFWEMRAGEERSGVSMHTLTPQADAGPLIAQRAIPLELGLRFPQLVKRQALAAGELVREELPRFLRGEIAPRPQPEGATYEPMPKSQDFFLSADMSCRAVAAFVAGMRGIAPVAVNADGLPLLVENVTLLVEDPDAEGKPGDTNFDGRETVHFRAANGWVKMLVAPPS